jgi:ABC-2 type transport system permease protein
VGERVVLSYIKIYTELQAANLRAQSMYPFNFAMILVSVTFFGLTNIILTWVLTQKVPIIAGWNLYQIVFIMSLWRFSHGFFITFFQQIWNLEYLIREGLMDRFLIRPLNPLFQFFAMHGFGVISPPLRSYSIWGIFSIRQSASSA